MDEKVIRRVHRITALVTFSALVFLVFFQLGKSGPFRDINPFGIDPYDAIGSIAVQAAVLIGILTYARALRLKEGSRLGDRPREVAKIRLILHGDVLVAAAIGVTLVGDAVAELVEPFRPSLWADLLLVGLVVMFALVLGASGGVAVVFGRTRMATAPRDLTPADAIDDLWTLVRVPLARLAPVLPAGLVDAAEGFTSDRLFARRRCLRWLDPRTHWWRLVSVLGLLAGIILALLQL